MGFLHGKGSRKEKRAAALAQLCKHKSAFMCGQRNKKHCEVLADKAKLFGFSMPRPKARSMNNATAEGRREGRLAPYFFSCPVMGYVGRAPCSVRGFLWGRVWRWTGFWVCQCRARRVKISAS